MLGCVLLQAAIFLGKVRKVQRTITVLKRWRTNVKLRLEENISQKELEVLVKYAVMDEEVERLISLIRAADIRVKCKYDGQEKYVNASDIYYIESVDKKTFVYGEKEVYQTDFRLHELEEMLQNAGFTRISKSCVLNIHILDTIKPLLNSRLEATLQNGERVFVTRKYLGSIKEVLQKGI